MKKLKFQPIKRDGETNLVICRHYYRKGTNGKLYVDGQLHSFTIELPWKENKNGVSCIPEGSYPLAKRYSERFGHHLQVMNVPGRDLILLHPANDALKELRGCIAPVTMLAGPGKGTESRKAFSSLITPVYAAIERGEPATLTVFSEAKAIAAIRKQIAEMFDDQHNAV